MAHPLFTCKKVTFIYCSFPPKKLCFVTPSGENWGIPTPKCCSAFGIPGLSGSWVGNSVS